MTDFALFLTLIWVSRRKNSADSDAFCYIRQQKWGIEKEQGNEKEETENPFSVIFRFKEYRQFGDLDKDYLIKICRKI